MSEKKTANVGDLADLLVVLRDSYQANMIAIDEFLNKVGTKVLAPNVARFTGKDYDRLGWTSFQTKKGQTWERVDLAKGFGDLGEVKDNLVDLCQSPSEATIQAPFIAFEYGYWIFRATLYRRPMPTPR